MLATDHTDHVPKMADRAKVIVVNGIKLDAVSLLPHFLSMLDESGFDLKFGRFRFAHDAARHPSYNVGNCSMCSAASVTERMRRPFLSKSSRMRSMVLSSYCTIMMHTRPEYLPIIRMIGLPL